MYDPKELERLRKLMEDVSAQVEASVEEMRAAEERRRFLQQQAAQGRVPAGQLAGSSGPASAPGPRRLHGFPIAESRGPAPQRVPGPGAVREIASSPSGIPSLKRLALRACGRRVAISQEELDRDYHWVGTGERYEDSAADGLAGCERTLFLELLQMNRTGRPDQGISADWLNSRSEFLSRPAQPAPRPAPEPNPAPRRSEPPARKEPSKRDCCPGSGFTWCG